MTDQPSIPKISRATWVGLFLSLFAMVVIRYAFVFFMPEITFTSAILKENFCHQRCTCNRTNFAKPSRD